MNIRLKSNRSLSPTLSPSSKAKDKLGEVGVRKNYVLILCTMYLVLGTLSSCKMNYSFNGASVPPEAKTVSIQYFQDFTSTSSPTLKQTLTEALKDIFSTQTHLSLINNSADLNFEGSITGYATAPIAIQSNDQAAQNRLTITITVKYTNIFDEKKNFETSFSRFADYPSDQTLSSVEAGLISEINKQLVQDIYNKAFNNW